MRVVHRLRSGQLIVAMALSLGLAAVFADGADAHRRAERGHRHHRDRTVQIVRRPAPRFIIRPHIIREPRYVVAPGYVGSQVITVGGDRMHWSASLGLYIPNGWIEASYGEWAPRGSIYYDPYCRQPYSSLSSYRVHLHDCGHPAALMLTASRSPRGAMVWDESPCGPWGH